MLLRTFEDNTVKLLTRVKLISFFLLLAFCLVTSVAARQDTFSVGGVVVNAETTEPLAGVRVMLAPGAYATRTDSKGLFVFKGVARGRYTVVPTHLGWVVSPEDRPLGTQRTVDVVAGNMANIVLKMEREAVISGRAVFPDGSPIAGTAMATLLTPTFDEYGRRFLGWIPNLTYDKSGSFVQTNDRGEFRLFGLQRGDYFLTVSAGVSVVYYSGTEREAEARPISVSAGGNADLGTIVLQRTDLPKALLEFVGPSGISFTDAAVIVDEQRSYHPPVTREGVKASIPLAPGKHELFVRMAARESAYFALVNLEMGNTDRIQQVPVRLGAKVTARIRIEGEFRPDLTGLRCVLRGQLAAGNRFRGCLGQTVSPGMYFLEIQNMPSGTSISSAKVGDHDVLQNGLDVVTDTELEIILGTGGGKVTGKALRNGLPSPATTVVLVPNSPFRHVGPLYRMAYVDANGDFEIASIPPGSYHLFAWQDLQGAAYRNEEFMRPFEGKGVPVEIQEGTSLRRDLLVEQYSPVSRSQ